MQAASEGQGGPGGGGGEGGKKTLEEVTLGMLEELGAAVRPARYVPNEEALGWAMEQLANSAAELDCEWFSIGDPQATKLAEALKRNKTLKVLKLRYNEIRDPGASVLAAAVAEHPALETLTLGNNIIASQGAADLARAAASSKTLRNLDLRYNAIGPDLPDSFTSLRGLTRLDVSANRLVALPPNLGLLTTLSELVVERNHSLAPKSLLDPQPTAELLSAIRGQAGGS